MMNNYKYILSFFIVVLIASCAQEDAAVSSDSGPIYKGPYYNEFLACNAGPAFQDGIQEMLAAWQKLPAAKGLGWAGVYAPKGDDHRFSNGSWELEWDSKESSDNAFNNPSPEFLAWSEKYSDVMTCDIEGRFPWTFYLPTDPGSFGEVMGENGYFASEFLACNYKEGKSGEDLRAAVVQFNEYLDQNGSEVPYFYGVYFPQFDTDTDFLWGNWHASFETMEIGNKDWEENGKAMQAKFDEISTCISPDYYDSRELYNNPNT